MASLGVNIDHIANIREARRTVEPDPVSMALLAELGGADGITVHLREDRRHIQDRDVELLRQTVRSRLNLEMAATDEMVAIALRIKPDMVTLVPERREEVTTEGGLDVAGQEASLGGMVHTLQAAGIPVSLFVDPEATQLQACKPRGPAGWNCTRGAMPMPTGAPSPRSWRACRRARPSPGSSVCGSMPAMASRIRTLSPSRPSLGWKNSTLATRSWPALSPSDCNRLCGI